MLYMLYLVEASHRWIAQFHKQVKKMNLTLNEVISEHHAPILCWYLNTTSQVQIARITNIPIGILSGRFFQGIVFCLKRCRKLS